MNDVITLKDTPNYKHYLKKIKVIKERNNSRSTSYRLYTNEPNLIRRELLPGGRHAIMLAGGPKLIEGELIPKNEVVVTQILLIKNSSGNNTYILALKV